MRFEIVDFLVTRELRRAVLRPSRPVGSVLPGDDEPAAIHFGGFDEDGTLVGACLVLPAAEPSRPDADGGWQLRSMATAEAQRGRGVGTAMLAAAVDEIVRRGGRVLWCNARTPAVPFYRRAGFEVEGAEFVPADTGIPHFRMRRANLSPDLPRQEG